MFQFHPWLTTLPKRPQSSSSQMTRRSERSGAESASKTFEGEVGYKSDDGIKVLAEIVVSSAALLRSAGAAANRVWIGASEDSISLANVGAVV